MSLDADQKSKLKLTSLTIILSSTDNLSSLTVCCPLLCSCSYAIACRFSHQLAFSQEDSWISTIKLAIKICIYQLTEKTLIVNCIGPVLFLKHTKTPSRNLEDIPVGHFVMVNFWKTTSLSKIFLHPGIQEMV